MEATHKMNVSQTQALLENNVGVPKVEADPKFGKRHGQLVLLFLMVLVGYVTRVMMSVGIVAMTDPEASSNTEISTFSWTNKSIILSAFFWGYVLPQILAGWLANRYGPKWFLVITGLVGSLVGFGIPFAAVEFGSIGVIICRIIQGICQGFVYPSTHYLLSQWAPLSERSRFGFYAYGGSQLGTLLSMFLSGLLASSDYGWPMIFYAFSSASLIWCILFGFFGHNSPNDHPSITEQEKKLICSTTGSTSENKKTTPWRKIFTSIPVWSLIVASCGYVWTYDLMLTQVPNYMNKVLNFDMKKNTYLSPIPYLVFWMLNFVMSFLSDFSINKHIFSIGTCRKVFSAIGFLVSSIALICLGNCDSSRPLVAYFLLVLAVGGCSGGKCGFFLNQLDIAPNYAGTLMGIVNCISNGFGMFGPVACQYLVRNETNPEEWKSIFYLSAGISVVSCIIFTIFGSGEVQEWNDHENIEKKKKTENLVEFQKIS